MNVPPPVSSIHAASAIYPNLTYDPARDLAPVTVLIDVPNVVIVNPSLPARDLRELVALARQKPGQLTFGSAGNGSSTHLAGELFLLAAGVRMSHVPYRGSSMALNDLVALADAVGEQGEVQGRRLALGSTKGVPSSEMRGLSWFRCKFGGMTPSPAPSAGWSCNRPAQPSCRAACRRVWPWRVRRRGCSWPLST